MRRRITYTIFIILGILMIGAVVYVAVFNWDSVLKFLGQNPEKEALPYEEVNNEPVQNTAKPVVNSNEPRRVVVDPLDTSPAAKADNSFGKDDLTRMAESFAERFGSFSNQSNFANILDLKLFMSDKMKKWADKYITAHRAGNNSEIYYGITTKAIGHTVVEWDDDAGTGQVLVNTRRRESTSTTLNSTDAFSQNMLIYFIKEKGAWKVDSAFWQD
jgi:hypothetical protein